MSFSEVQHPSPCHSQQYYSFPFYPVWEQEMGGELGLWAWGSPWSTPDGRFEERGVEVDLIALVNRTRAKCMIKIHIFRRRAEGSPSTRKCPSLTVTAYLWSASAAYRSSRLSLLGVQMHGTASLRPMCVGSIAIVSIAHALYQEPFRRFGVRSRYFKPSTGEREAGKGYLPCARSRWFGRQLGLICGCT